MASVQIRLAACIGVRSNPHLVSHFLEHYERLGVTEYLIVLHAERGDPRATTFKNCLGRRGIEPVREIQEFSARLKGQHIGEVVRDHCEPESWVIHADLDELQVYPGGLVPYLKQLEQRGRSFARGRLVDRLAPQGELIDIQPTPSIWEQFPISWAVTRKIAKGWDRKVCAARARVPILEDGSHAVVYGPSKRLSYWLTHHSPRPGERRVEVHHFKWDSTLQERIRDKIEGRGGDQDCWHGTEFLSEYRRLDAHLRRHGRIQVPADAPRPKQCTGGRP